MHANPLGITGWRRAYGLHFFIDNSGLGLLLWITEQGRSCNQGVRMPFCVNRLRKHTFWKTYVAGNGRMEAVYEKLYKGRYREAGGG